MTDNVEDLSHLYQSFTSEAAEADEGKLPSYDTMKLGEGTKVFRMLPPPVGFAHPTPWLMVHEHWIDLPGGKYGFACLTFHTGSRCPGCIKAEQLRKSGSPADREVAERIAAKPTAFAHVIERGNEEKGVQTLRLPQSVLRDLIKYRKDAVTGGDDFSDPFQGFDIQCIGTKKGDYINYDTKIARRSTPLSADRGQIKEWLTTRPDLMQKLKLKTWDDIVKAVAEKSASGTSAPSAATRFGETASAPAIGAGKSVSDFNDVSGQPPGGGDDDIPF